MRRALLVATLAALATGCVRAGTEAVRSGADAQPGAEATGGCPEPAPAAAPRASDPAEELLSASLDARRESLAVRSSVCTACSAIERGDAPRAAEAADRLALALRRALEAVAARAEVPLEDLELLVESIQSAYRAAGTFRRAAEADVPDELALEGVALEYDSINAATSDVLTVRDSFINALAEAQSPDQRLACWQARSEAFDAWAGFVEIVLQALDEQRADLAAARQESDGSPEAGEELAQLDSALGAWTDLARAGQEALDLLASPEHGPAELGHALELARSRASELQAIEDVEALAEATDAAVRCSTD